jgi:hypothetical protein
MSFDFSSLNSVYQFIGDQLGGNGKLGVFSKYPSQVAAFTLILPIAIDAIKILAEHYSSNNVKTTPIDYKARVLTFLDSNKYSIFTSILSGALILFAPEVPAAVYIGYSFISITHLINLKNDYKGKIDLELIKNLFATCISFSTIGMMVSRKYPIRWHHMSYGLLSMFPNLTALNTFGAGMALDSMGYWLKPNRDNFDFSNIFVKYLPWYIVQLSVLTICEIANYILKPNIEPTPKTA